MAAVTFLVVVHGLLITTLIEMLDSSKTKLGVENASVTKIVYQDGTYTVESVGDMSYVAKRDRKCGNIKISQIEIRKGR